MFYLGPNAQEMGAKRCGDAVGPSLGFCGFGSRIWHTFLGALQHDCVSENCQGGGGLPRSRPRRPEAEICSLLEQLRRVDHWNPARAVVVTVSVRKYRCGEEREQCNVTARSGVRVGRAAVI